MSPQIEPPKNWLKQEQEYPPVLDDVRRQRMLRRFEAAVREGQAASVHTAATHTQGFAKRRVVAVAVVASLAAAAALGVMWWRGVQAPSQLQVAEVRTQASSKSLRFGDSTIEVAPNSIFHTEVASQEHIVQRLEQGEVVVSYHPRSNDRQTLHIHTPVAKVEVVGTRFRVRADREHTEVAVFEGIVRVTPKSESIGKLLRAGEHVRVSAQTQTQTQTQTQAQTDARETERAVQERALVAETSPKEEAERASPPVARRAVNKHRPPSEVLPPTEQSTHLGDGATNDERSTESEAVDDDFVIEVEGGERALSANELAQADDATFALEVRKVPAATLERIAKTPAPERQRHLLYRFVREAKKPEHLGEAWSMVALSWRKQGMPKRALEGYRRARRAGRGTAWERHALFESAMLHRSLGEAAKVQASLEDYLKLAPDGYRAALARSILCEEKLGPCPAN